MSKTEIREETINDLIEFLNDIRAKKKELLPSADYYDEKKSANYDNLIEWINQFSKKLNINLIVQIRTENPAAKIHFYTKKDENNKDAIPERTFSMIVGSPDRLKEYDYFDLSKGMFLDYKQNNNSINNNGYYESIFNILGWLADNNNSIKSTIQSNVEKELFKQISQEEKELDKLIKVIKNR